MAKFISICTTWHGGPKERLFAFLGLKNEGHTSFYLVCLGKGQAPCCTRTVESSRNAGNAELPQKVDFHDFLWLYASY